MNRKEKNCLNPECDEIIGYYENPKKLFCNTSCKNRFHYLSDKENFNSSYISGFIGSMRQYNSLTLNGLKMKTWTDVGDNLKDWSTIFPFLKKINRFSFYHSCGIDKELFFDKSISSKC